MTFVIAQPCVGVKDAACLDVCPVDCIHSTPRDPQYYIDPAACIDCGACELICPVNAIYPAYLLPPHWRAYAEINARYFGR
ncbi:MAG TPA: ferredoxin family protein [Thermodesulfobacteriota bacterium]